MLFSALLTLSLLAEPSTDELNDLLELEMTTACASDAGVSRHCALLTAFRSATPASAKKPVFALGTWEEEGGSGFSFFDLNAKGAVVAEVTPDDDAERAKFVAIAAGKKDALYKALKKDAAKQPHLATTVADGSLMFKVNRPLGGHWVRTSGGKLYVLQITGGTDRGNPPKLRVSEFLLK